MEIIEAAEKAFEFYRRGDFRQAELTCKKILEIQSDNGQILHLLGSIYHKLGNYDLAIAYLESALIYMPDNSDLYYDLGNIFQETEEIDKAIPCYQKAIKLNPNYVDAYNNLGNIFQDTGESDEAITCYQKALQLNPRLEYIYNNLGLIFQNRGQFDESTIYYQKALQLNPLNADAYYNLGITFKEKGQIEEAINCYQMVLQLNPEDADAYYNLGIALHKKGLLEESIKAYKKGIELNPSIPEVFYNLGNVLKDKGELAEAIENYRNAIVLKSDFVYAYYNLGNALIAEGNIGAALNAYETAVAHEPDYVLAQWAHCIWQIPIIYEDHTSIQLCRNRYYEELIKLRDTIPLRTVQDIDNAASAIGSHQPFLLAYQGFNDRQLQKIYGEMVCKIMALRYPQWALCPMPSCIPGEPLRIGIVSCYFYYHSNWKIPIKGWIENIDKQRFSLFGYYTGKKKDKETAVARKSFNRFIEDIDSFEDFCKIIRNDNIHILVFPEIGMDPMTVKLAALRLAPIQCTSWGHPDTSGLPTIDYFLSSDLMEPPDADSHYTEKLFRLPNLSIYYTSLDFSPADINRETFNLRQKSVLYLSCQSLYKYLPQHDEIYVRIAKQIDDCQFIFIADDSDYVTEQFRLRINRSFKHFALNADDYIVFLPPVNPVRYHALNLISDIYLDSVGWSGCNSTLEAIACNLPIVTLLGEFMRGRHSTAILTMMGLTETIADSLDNYIEIAVRLGNNSEWRNHISEKIADTKHRIYRDMKCVTALEEFFERVVKERME
jgi:protein O-GlcNAc transferase